MSSCSVALHVEEPAGAALHIAEPSAIALDAGGDLYAVGPPFYEGSYDITPSAQAQTIPIDGMRAAHDIVIEPIPSNYGLITWNGSTITVS